MPQLLLLGIVACASAVFGLVFNAYVMLVLVYNRQTRTANSLLLLHLALVDILSCLETLSMTTPAAVNGRWGDQQQESLLCTVHGFAWTVLLPVAVWTLCGLNCDRYAAIAIPLHYSRLVRSRRIAVFLALVWLFGVGLAVPPFFRGINRYSYQPSRASCTADFTDRAAGPWYPLTYTALSLILPAFLILLCNLRTLVIARHHRHRIVAAIYEVTMRAQATITHQRNPFYLSKYKGRCAIVTIVQLVGSVLLLYGPQCSLMLWEATTGHVGPPELAGVATGLVACSPLINGFVYGVKSHALRKAFKSFLRRQLYTSEVRNEIQRRGSVGANHAWSYVLLRMGKNSGALAMTPCDPGHKRLDIGPEVRDPLPMEKYCNAGAGLGLAGLGLTLGIGLSDSDLGDSCPALPAITPDIQLADADGRTCGSLESVLLSKEASPAETSRQSPESVENSRSRLPSGDAVLESHALLSPYHDAHPAKCGHLLRNVHALPVENDQFLLKANERSAIEHQLRKSLEMLSKKNGCLQRRSPSCGLHLELLQTSEGRNSRTIKVSPPLFIERGSI